MIVYEKEQMQPESGVPPCESGERSAVPAAVRRPRRRALGIVPLQAALCGLLLAALLLLRAFVPETFRTVREYVAREMARSVLISEDDL